MPETAKDRQIEAEWGRVWEDHPHVYQIWRPHRIDRLRYTDWARHIEPKLPARARVLEAGCGSGRHSLYLAHRGHRVVALDKFGPPLVHVGEARRRYQRRRGAVDLNRARADLFALPFADGTFDLVFNGGVLEHYPTAARRRQALSEMVRVVRPGGLVAVCVPNAGHRLAAVWEAWIHRATAHDDYDMPEQALTLSDLSEDLVVLGLQPVQLRAIDAWDSLAHYPRPRALQLAAHLSRRWMPRPGPARALHWGVRLLAVGRRPAVSPPRGS